MRVTGEYSYHSRHIGGDGFCLVGDAFAFLDPLFSTGVFLALKSGEMAADAMHEALLADDVMRRALRRLLPEAAARRRQRSATWCCAFYDETFSFREFLERVPARCSRSWSTRWSATSSRT